MGETGEECKFANVGVVEAVVHCEQFLLKESEVAGLWSTARELK